MMPQSQPPTDPTSHRRLYAEKMTISEAAEACHVDYDTFLAWVRKGVIPYVTVGPSNQKRVYRSDVEALIREGEAGR